DPVESTSRGNSDVFILTLAGSERYAHTSQHGHELAHLLLYLRSQAVFKGFRRTPTPEAKLKDPSSPPSITLQDCGATVAGILSFIPGAGAAIQTLLDGRAKENVRRRWIELF